MIHQPLDNKDFSTPNTILPHQRLCTRVIFQGWVSVDED